MAIRNKDVKKTKTLNREDKTCDERAVCINHECKLRKAGCKGFDTCPGYKTK
ncbi:hypothetical protein MCHI_001767 [Candidatus Magnetoovum chiemensis]|nr:hypothetical protein MCHI_001767 [Candidatus Magnetoovum chiemensis]